MVRIIGAVQHRNRMGGKSFFRLRSEDGREALVKLSHTLLGEEVYDQVKAASLGDQLHIVGTEGSHPRLGPIIIAKEVTFVPPM